MIGIGGPIGLRTKNSYISERKRHLTLVNIICGTWPGDPLNLAALPHSPTRRPGRHRRTPTRLSLRRHLGLAVHPRELGFTLSVSL